MRQSVGRWFALGALVVLAAPWNMAQAACPTRIVAGEVANGTQYLPEGGDCTVESGGLLESRNHAIYGTDGHTVIIDGEIEMEDGYSAGVDLDDDNTIILRGRISGSGEYSEGFFVKNRNRIENHGTIDLNGGENLGIFSRDDNVILNTGDIVVDSDYYIGLHANDRNFITNEGSITEYRSYEFDFEPYKAMLIRISENQSSVGSGVIGFTLSFSPSLRPDEVAELFPEYFIDRNPISYDANVYLGDNNRFHNSGLLETNFSSQITLLANRNNQIINSGSIFSLEENTIVTLLRSGNRLENSGWISVFERSSTAVFAREDNVISNSGWISAFGASANAVTLDDGNRLENHGLIAAIGPNSRSIQVFGTDNHIRLAPGSTIVGQINFFEQGNTLAIENVPETGSAFYAISGEIPEITVAADRPFVVANNGVSIVDTAPFAAESNSLASLTAGLISVLPTGLSQPAFAQTARFGETQLAQNPNVADESGAIPNVRKPGALRFWTEGFGSYLSQEGDGSSSDSRTRQHGIAVGVEWIADDGWRVGAYVGGARGNARNETATDDTDSDSVFAGVQAGVSIGESELDLALTVGHSSFERERRLLDTGSPSGVSTAESDYESVFLATALTAAHRFALGPVALVPSVTLGYSVEHLDGYSERGSANGLSIDDRTLHLGFARAKLALPVSFPQANGADLGLTLEGGLDGRRRFGSETVSGQIQGTPVTFDPGGEREVISAFAGARIAYRTAAGAVVSLHGEAGRSTDGGSSLLGRARVSFRF